MSLCQIDKRLLKCLFYLLMLVFLVQAVCTLKRLEAVIFICAYRVPKNREKNEEYYIIIAAIIVIAIIIGGVFAYISLISSSIDTPTNSQRQLLHLPRHHYPRPPQRQPQPLLQPSSPKHIHLLHLDFPNTNPYTNNINRRNNHKPT